MGTFGFPGYAIGGLSVGEPVATTERLVAATAAELPADRPRYLMGVGTPEQIRAYTRLGVDLFDCVLPTRFGRTGTAFGADRRLNLQRSRFQRDERPIDASCDCLACARYSRAYLHAGVRAALPYAARLISIHNVRALVRTAEAARAEILERKGADEPVVGQNADDQSVRQRVAKRREMGNDPADVPKVRA
jgi:queuine tRNA-ribosyltransferase